MSRQWEGISTAEMAGDPEMKSREMATAPLSFFAWPCSLSEAELAEIWDCNQLNMIKNAKNS